MELQQLRCLIAVLEEGGFKKATTRVHVTQPALSYQIKQLEQEIGTSLFERRPGGVTPTEAGRVLYLHARSILGAVDRARRSIAELAEGVMGEVRIGTVNSVGIYFLPELLWAVQKKYPDAKPRVLYRNSDEIIEDLLQNRIDFALVANPRPDRRLKSETVLIEDVSLVCGQSHDFFQRDQLRPADLKGVQFVALSADNPTGQLIVKHLHRLGVHVEPVVSTDNIETVKKMTEIGLGVAFLPDMVTRFSQDSTVGSMQLKSFVVGPRLQRRISLVTWRHHKPGRAVRAFLDELMNHAEQWKQAVQAK